MLKPETRARDGVVRLFLEVRYDFPFSFDEPLTLKEITRKIIDEHEGLHNMVRHREGEYAECVHAIMIDVDKGKGIENVPYKPEYEMYLFETDEEISEILY